MERELETELKHLKNIAFTMENLLPIPGTNLRIGLDAMVGFVPVVGDIIGLLPAGYIIARAHRAGVSRRRLIRMGLNVGVDVIVGFVPLIGDLFDVSWNASTRNVALLEAHLNEKAARTETAQAALTLDQQIVGGV